jgi:hypothetical protein
MTQIVNMILDRLTEKLTFVCQTNVGPSELIYADVVKKGLLQQSKTAKNVQIGVNGGDHDNPEYLDGIVSLAKLPEIAMNMAAREIGGGQMWWRRGVVRLECFFVRERLTEDEAHIAGYEILGLVQSAIETTDLSGLVDDYGERATNIFCFGNTYFESGGPPKSYIFRGKVLWQCLTERP